MSAPAVSLQPESIADFQTNFKKTASIKGICECSATWLESKAVLTPLQINCELKFSGGADCDGKNGCTKVDYSVLPNLTITSLKNFIPTLIQCTSSLTVTVDLEKIRNIKYLNEKCTLSVANAAMQIKSFNLQDSNLPIAKLNVKSAILKNGNTALEVEGTIHKTLNIVCCGSKAFNTINSNYRSTLPIFSAFSNRFVSNIPGT